MTRKRTAPVSAFGAAVSTARPAGHDDLMRRVLRLDDLELDKQFPAPVDVAMPDGLPYWRGHVRQIARRAVDWPAAPIAEPYSTTSRLRSFARRPALDPAGPPIINPKEYV